MIGKVSIGKTFRGCVNYVMGKPGAEILSAYGVRIQSPSQATNDFNAIRNQTQSISNAVWHTSISFAIADKVDNQLMINVANDYLAQMKLEKNQYLLVRHTDTAHQHMHIISNRIGFDGKVVSDQWCKNRTAHTCDTLEEKYNLTIARNQLRGKAEDKRRGVSEAKKIIESSIESAIKMGVSNYATLDQELNKQSITLQIQKQSTGRVNGVTFKIGNLVVKGSGIKKDYSYKRLLKLMEHNQSITNGIKL